MRYKIIETGVRNLKEFGYPNASKNNILTDPIYSAFFKSMLEDNLGKALTKQSINFFQKSSETSPNPPALRLYHSPVLEAQSR